ncbi:hypothetical protein BDV38DRAFT_224808 [Aspergillus pseudotamarii]|uniref:DUF3074 domain-containing protein n=1 Tax=Aspergillus pseudotamarii TaxID=132259 RepID=A0A5N6SBI6_ASPPS|nr:uncharacterized protein BDV38DRAFT_224808 [Aspergillus pseudotamarii]KAE8132078.1 hypothetical protein BDV38DRAFT_224808 [Aspergillus pseudotamarii]
MAALQEALECLAPTTWDEVPTDPSALRTYINDLSTKAHLIVNSVPEPPPSTIATTTHHVKPSPARLNTTDPTLQSLQQQWSKPIKVSSTRDNPLDLHIHKLPGSDGKGHWFGRRSVHEGLPFSTWQAKLSSEMTETLKANRERMKHGQTPDQSVRGIGAEKQVETIEVKDESGEKVLAHVTVFHVSAQFPKPTTPRDFVSLIVSWEVGAEEGGRFWMMVSKPVEHAEAPPCQGYIRGQYESVEFIREIPAKRGSDGDGQGVVEGSRNGELEAASKEKQGGNGKEEERAEEANPVEWIMVTRSDPGGNIPRWMVEKGTPKSICSDAVKFLDWACRDPNSPAEPGMDDGRQRRRRNSLHTAGVEETEDSEISDSEFSDTEVEHHGLIASFAYLLNAGLERYAPQAVLDYIPGHSHHSSGDMSDVTTEDVERAPRSSGDPVPQRDATEKDKDDTRSQLSQDKASSINSGLATPIESGHHNIPPVDLMKIEKKDGKLTSHEKQLAKLAQRKREVEAQLDRVREDIRSLHLPSREEGSKRDKASAAALAAADASSDQVSTSAGSSNQRQTPESRSSSSNNLTHPASSRDTAKMHKVASGLFNEESKLLKQLGKIEKHQLKEASKIESKQRKQADQEEKSKSRTEIDILRHENEHLRKELERLRNERRQWLELIASLQTENTNLAAAAGKTEK